MKSFVPVIFASLLLTSTASAATFTVEQLNPAQLSTQNSVSLVKAGGALSVLAHRFDGDISSSYQYSHKALTDSGAVFATGKVSRPVTFNDFVYVKVTPQSSVDSPEIWRTSKSNSSGWTKVATVSTDTGDIMHIGDRLVLIDDVTNTVWRSKNGTTWKQKTFTGIRKQKDAIQYSSVATGTTFGGRGYVVVQQQEDSFAYTHLYSSTNGVDWTEIATSVFSDPARIDSIGGLFGWNHELYMLTTNTDGIAQWWKSTDGTTFSALEWNMPGNQARVLYKDSDSIMLATNVDNTVGWTVWQYTRGESWKVFTDVQGVGLGDAALSSDYVQSGMKYKKAWYAITQDSIPESSGDAQYNILRIKKQ